MAKDDWKLSEGPVWAHEWIAAQAKRSSLEGTGVTILRLDSEQLSFYRTKRGLIHVRDTYAEIHAGWTMCGRSLDQLTPMVERELSDEHLCQRCGAALLSERKWGNLGISKHRGRWTIAS